MHCVCNANPLSEETRRRVLPYAILALLAYTSVMSVCAGIITCGLLGVTINSRLFESLMAGAILIRHFGTLLILRRMATITGEPAPEVSRWGHVVYISIAGLLLWTAWI